VPPPYVVCIDVGHGGTDPGALGLDGLVEKNLTLDVSDRLAALLRADGVTVVLTRTTDASVSIQQRSDIANASHANVFLAVYFNAWTTPTPEGSVVLYPYARDIPFAQAMDSAVTSYLNPFGATNGGLVLRDNWWLQPTMPTATVESLFITNPHDAALLTQSSFRQGLANALKNGIEAYLPGILQRQQEIPVVVPGKLRAGSGPLAPPPTAQPVAGSPAAQPGAGHPGAAPSAAAVKPGGGLSVPAVLEWLLLLFGLALGIRYRRPLVRAGRAGFRVVAGAFRGSGVHHQALRRRRRLVRERAATAGTGQRMRTSPAYQELFRGYWDPALPADRLSPPDGVDLPGVEVRGRPVRPVRRTHLDELPL